MSYLCRTCAEQTASVNIFSSKKFVYAKLITCVRFNVTHDDGLPTHICDICVGKLKDAFNFIKQCEDSNKYFREQLENLSLLKNEIKIEDFSDDNCEFIELKSEEIFENLGKSLPDLVIKTNTKKKVDKKPCKKRSIIKKEPHKCRDCDEVFKFKHELRKHSKSHVKPVVEKVKKDVVNKCSYCQKCFVNDAASLKEHLKSKECREKYPCEPCDEMFYTSYHYDVHMNKYHAEKIPCEHCGKMFDKRHKLRKHIKNVHARDSSAFCKLCNKNYHNITRFQNHWKAKHKSKELFKCDLCDFTSRYKQSIRSHIYAHFNIRPYKCRFCTKAFTISKTCVDHEKLHTGVTPYQCPICGMAFAQKGNMKSHFKHNHKDVPYFEPKKDDFPELQPNKFSIKCQ